MDFKTDDETIRGFAEKAVTLRPQSMAKRAAISPPEADADRFRDNPAEIARYLTEAFEKNDLAQVLRAINDVMRAQNALALAEKTGLRRDRLCKTFGGDVSPQLSRVMELFAGMNVRLVVKPLPPRPTSPRPQLGGPRSSSKQPRPKGSGSL